MSREPIESTASSLAPAFLLSMPQLTDPNFSRTVVLLCKHSEEGAFGLVVNRPLVTSGRVTVNLDPPVSTDRELVLSETGFALPWEPEGFGPERPDTAEAGHVAATSAWGGSTIVDLPLRAAPRTGELQALSPNANVMHPHVIVPGLVTTIEAGTHLLVCAVGASHDAAAVQHDRAPAPPSDLVERLESFAARPDPQP